MYQTWMCRRLAHICGASCLLSELAILLQVHNEPRCNAPALALEAFSSWTPLIPSSQAPSGSGDHPLHDGSAFAAHQPFTAAAGHIPLSQDQQPAYSSWTPFGGSQPIEQPQSLISHDSSRLTSLHSQASTSSQQHSRSLSGSIPQQPGAQLGGESAWSALLPQPQQQSSRKLSNAAADCPQQAVEISAGRQVLDRHSSRDASRDISTDESGGPLSSGALQDPLTGWSPFGPSSGIGGPGGSSWLRYQLGPDMMSSLLEQSSPPVPDPSTHISQQQPATAAATSGQLASQSNPFTLSGMHNTTLSSGEAQAGFLHGQSAWVSCRPPQAEG